VGERGSRGKCLLLAGLKKRGEYGKIGNREKSKKNNKNKRKKKK